MSDNINIDVTYFLNPNFFYMINLDRRHDIYEARENEKQLSFVTSDQHTISVKDNVCYYSDDSKKWIRCVVDMIIGEDKEHGVPRTYALWAIDYGFPFCVTKTDKIVKIPTESATHLVVPQYAGLNVLPAVQRVDKNNKLVMQRVDSWSNAAIDFCKEKIEEAQSVEFVLKGREDEEDGYVFGDIIARNCLWREGKCSLRDELVERNLAIKPKKVNFLNLLAKTLAGNVRRCDPIRLGDGSYISPDFILVREIGCPRKEYINSDEYKKLLTAAIRKKEDQIAKTIKERSIAKVHLWMLQNGISTDPTDLDESVPIIADEDRVSLSPTIEDQDQLPENAARNMIGAALEALSIASSSKSRIIPVRSSPTTNPVIVVPAMYPPNTSQNLNASSSRLAKKNDSSSSSSEVWMELNVGQEYQVAVCHFGSCKRFFIQVIDRNDNWNNLMAALDEIHNPRRLTKFKIGDMCLVKVNEEYHRAMVIRHSEIATMLFCVDSAQLVHFLKEPVRIFEIPKRIINMMPFQAVRCRLSGVKAEEDFAITCLVYDKIIKRILQQRILVEKKFPCSPNLPLYNCYQPAINTYEVKLFSRDEDGKESFVNNLVSDYQLCDPLKL